MERAEDKQVNDNRLRNNRVRSGIYPMAGVFLLYQAYGLYNEISVTSGTEQILSIVFSIFFSIAGLIMILLGVSIMYRVSKKKVKEADKEDISSEG